MTWSVYGTINAGVTLTLAPGTVLKGGLTVLGTLDARGTADQPIIVTGSGDDAAGGDTNDDGDATHPRESIGGPRLKFYDTGASGSVLEYVEVRYGGGGNWLGSPYAAVEIEKAAPTLTNVTIRDTDNWALLLKQDAAPIIEHLTVENCIGAGTSDGYGVYVKSDAGAFTLSDVSFRRVTNWPLYLENMSQWGRVSDVHDRRGDLCPRQCGLRGGRDAGRRRAAQRRDRVADRQCDGPCRPDADARSGHGHQVGGSRDRLRHPVRPRDAGRAGDHHGADRRHGGRRHGRGRRGHRASGQRLAVAAVSSGGSVQSGIGRVALPGPGRDGRHGDGHGEQSRMLRSRPCGWARGLTDDGQRDADEQPAGPGSATACDVVRVRQTAVRI